MPSNAALTNGVGTFSVTLKTAGSQSITATDTIANSITGAQTGITVDPSSAATFSISSVSSPETAGEGFSITITALDAYGNTATSYTGTSSLSDLSWSISPQITSAFVEGVWTGTITVTSQGSDSFTATDVGITMTSNTFTVTHALAMIITVSPVSDSITAGNSDAFTALATDAYSNSWDVTSLVSWSISDGAAGSWSSNHYTSAFAGLWTVTADNGFGVLGTTSLVVTHASPVSVTISPSSATVIATTSQSFTALAADSYGNTWDVTSLVNWKFKQAPRVHGTATSTLQRSLEPGRLPPI